MLPHIINDQVQNTEVFRHTMCAINNADAICSGGDYQKYTQATAIVLHANQNLLYGRIYISGLSPLWLLPPLNVMT